MLAPSTIRRGVMAAIAAAVAFGATTPIVAWAGHFVGPFATAALLYAGAAGSAAIARHNSGEAKLRREDVPRLVAVALAGAAVAPVLLAWGLQRTGAMIGSLLLNLEAVFTVALARIVFREPIGTRVALAVGAMIAGGGALALGLSMRTDASLVGIIALAGATAGWAIDNTLTRPLAQRDPLAVVSAKGALGAALTGILAIVAGEPLPVLGPALALIACGATGYGLSLRLYLGAQRRIGAGRTGSVFALAPFVGAALAIALGDRAINGWTVAAAILFGVGVYLHLTEHHHHGHVHDAIDHDHPHRHDDGHHDHVHDPPFAGEHSHPHHHDRLGHDHDHGIDIHHDHH